jgi:hypothetical protein
MKALRIDEFYVNSLCSYFRLVKGSCVRFDNWNELEPVSIACTSGKWSTSNLVATPTLGSR